MPAFAQYLIDQKQAVSHTFVADPIDVRHVLETNTADVLAAVASITNDHRVALGVCTCTDSIADGSQKLDSVVQEFRGACGDALLQH